MNTTETLTAADLAVVRLDSGPRRWAVTYQGTIVAIELREKSARRTVEAAVEFEALLGKPSSFMALYARRAAEAKAAR